MRPPGDSRSQGAEMRRILLMIVIYFAVMNLFVLAFVLEDVLLKYLGIFFGIALAIAFAVLQEQ